MTEEQGGIDLSGLHRELDRLKVQLCRCQHQGTCVACQGFEVLRQQSQVVVAAASQPVLMQVAQEAAIKDMMNQLGGMQEKLGADPQLQELMSRMMDRVQEDLGGTEGLEQLLRNFGLVPPETTPPDDVPPDDRPSTPPRTDEPKEQ